MKSNYDIISLLVSNLIFLIIILTQGVSLIGVLFVFWSQNCIIGFFHFIKMISTKNPVGTNKYVFSEEKNKKHKIGTNNFNFHFQTYKKEAILRQMKKTEQLFYSIFFLLHYGLFHIGYLVAILFIAPIMMFMSQPNITIVFNEYFSLVNPFLWLSIGLFFINHLISYKQYYDPKKQLNLSSYVFLPYLRVIPMHLIIFVAGWLLLSQQTITNNPIAYTLVILIFLKTMADLIMHVYEHKETIKKPLKRIVKSIAIFTLVFVLIVAFIPAKEPVYQSHFVSDNEINNCHDELDIYNCFSDLAIKYNDYNICENVKHRLDSSENSIDTCYYLIAEKTSTIKTCNLIKDSEFNLFCKDNLTYIIAVKDNNHEKCYEILTKEPLESCLNKTTN